jgi:serine/threonine protein kinase
MKPDNIYLLKNRAGIRDFVKILDFGVSKFTGMDQNMEITKVGAIMGTPYYMSPEQARGDPADHRSDIYAVGVVSDACRPPALRGEVVQRAPLPDRPRSRSASQRLRSRLPTRAPASGGARDGARPSATSARPISSPTSKRG